MPSLPDQGIDAGLIEDARQRQRRHRRIGAVLIALTALAAAGSILGFALGGGGSGGGRNGGRYPGAGPAPATSESPAAVFAQDPYMGVACHNPNSISCDRVGLAVWLRQPATVTATIAGAPLKLNAPWRHVTHDSHGALYAYAGFLQPAGITTRLRVLVADALGMNSPSPLVRFRIDYGHGSIVTTQQRVYLSAGWG
jgi:hypothetical protein